MAIKRGSKVDVGFSAASMTDLMFLLLLFMFMATTLINPNALQLRLPKSANPLDEKPLTSVSITADLRYYVELEPVAFPELEGALKAKLTGRQDPTISLHCDRSVPVEELVKVMNIARDNNYKLILATSPN